jgi:hypothetical protein
MEINTIFSVELQKLTDINPELNEQFFTTLIQALPQIGKEAPNFYLINNNFTLQNQFNLNHINIYNNFVIQSQQKGQLLQLIKTAKNDSTSE